MPAVGGGAQAAGMFGAAAAATATALQSAATRSSRKRKAEVEQDTHVLVVEDGGVYDSTQIEAALRDLKDKEAFGRQGHRLVAQGISFGSKAKAGSGGAWWRELLYQRVVQFFPNAKGNVRVPSHSCPLLDPDLPLTSVHSGPRAACLCQSPAGAGAADVRSGQLHLGASEAPGCGRRDRGDPWLHDRSWGQDAQCHHENQSDAGCIPR